MAVAIVTIICVAMIIIGGMTLSQGILTSADAAATSVEAISVREGEIMRTELDILRAAQLAWGDYTRITVQNSGQTKLASFDKWDVIISYEADGGTLYSTWLPYTTDASPENNEWTKARIGYNGPAEYFEPGIINPGEEMVILAGIDPLPGGGTSGEASLTAPNGIYDVITLVNPGYPRLTPQSESISLAGTRYYELVEAAPADGAAMTAGTEFDGNESGGKLLYNTGDAARAARFIYPLLGIETIPAQEWTVYYHVYIYGGGTDWPKNDDEVSYSINISVRQADGTLRADITSGAAVAYVNAADKGSWVTISGTYSFAEYAVVDQDDYLEIAFYGATAKKPGGSTGYLQLSIDNDSLAGADQTRIEAH